MLLILLFFFVLYLVPTVRAARRKAWVLQESYKKKHSITYPARQVTSSALPGSPYVYINHTICKMNDVCGRCGGDKDYHPGQTYSNLRFCMDDDVHMVCAKYTAWNKINESWPEQTIAEYKSVPSMIVPALALSLAWPGSLVGAGYNKVKPDYSKFALPPEEVRTQIRLKELEEQNDLLERQLKIGPYSE